MTFPIDRVRGEFPALSRTDQGNPCIYLDSPGGTQVPSRVAAAVSRCLLETNANLDGQFVTSREAGGVVTGAHDAMADFLGAGSGREIVIGPNMTTLTFHLSRSICRDFAPGDEIIVTRMDHEGNVGPWLEIARDKGLEIRWLAFDRDSWQIEGDALEAVLTDRSRLLCLNFASNLTGSINDVARLTSIARAAGVKVFIDAVQLAPHRLVDVQAIDCDFLACSSYKFFGPHLGILWGREDLLRDMHAYKCRCSSDDLPFRHETGTPQIELLAGLSATVGYFEWLGEQSGETGSRRRKLAAAFEASRSYEDPLTQRLIAGLRDIPGISIQGIVNPNRAYARVPTVSFRHTASTPAHIAGALAADGIFVWNGHNYAYEVVRQLEIPEDEGVLRIGIAHYNTESEIDRVVESVRIAVH